MRLIDADALLESVKDYPFVQHALQAQTGKMPTVEAVPVEWLEGFRDGLDTLSESQLMRAIDLIIDAYRVEKKREENA